MANSYLSKSDFLKYQTCPGYFWIWKNKSDIIPEETREEKEQNRIRFEEGYEVEGQARLLFPEGVLVEGQLGAAKQRTDKLIAEGKNTIFQATVITDEGLLAMADIITKNPDDSWNIYEVKSTNEVKDEHIVDSAFQKVSFAEAGYKIGDVSIIHLNPKYKKQGQIDPNQLLTIESVVDKIKEIEPEIRQMTRDALEYMRKEDEPKTCSCHQKTKSNHCPTFRYFHPEVPEYSIYNLNRVSEKKLNTLLDMEVYHVHDIPDDFKMTEKQANQVTVAKLKKALIDHDHIREELSTLKFPLYFLDYETVSTAIPIFDGTSPYQQVCFQYSLHILPSADSQPVHQEFLATNKEKHPIPPLLKQMKNDIGAKGSVIVWNKGFEMGRNTEMAEMYPKYRDFLLGVNARVYDLMEIFAKQYHVHPDFHGSVSIKAVLPVLVPELSYKKLDDIQNGAIATIRWYESIVRDMPQADRDKIYANLLKYCELDTLAMYEIYEHLRTL